MSCEERANTFSIFFVDFFETINLEPALISQKLFRVHFSHSIVAFKNIYVRTLSKGQWAYNKLACDDTCINQEEYGSNRLYLNDQFGGNGVFFVYDDYIEQVLFPKLPNGLFCDSPPGCYSVNISRRFDCVNGMRNFSTTLIPLPTDDSRAIALEDENFLLQSIIDTQLGTFTKDVSLVDSYIIYYLRIASGNYVLRQDYRDPNSIYEIPRDYYASLLYNYDRSSDQFGRFVRLRNYDQIDDGYRCKDSPPEYRHRNIKKLESQIVFRAASDFLRQYKDDEYDSPFDYKLFNLNPSVDDPILLFVRIDYKTNQLVIITCDYGRCLNNSVGIPDYTIVLPYLESVTGCNMRLKNAITNNFNMLLRILKNPGDEAVISVFFPEEQSIFIPFRVLYDNKTVEVLVNSSYVCSGDPCLPYYIVGDRCSNSGNISDSERRKYSYESDDRFRSLRCPEYKTKDVIELQHFQHMWRYSYGNKYGCTPVNLVRKREDAYVAPRKFLVVSEDCCMSMSSTNIVKSGKMRSDSPVNASVVGSFNSSLYIIIFVIFQVALLIGVAIYKSSVIREGFGKLRSAFRPTCHSNDQVDLYQTAAYTDNSNNRGIRGRFAYLRDSLTRFCSTNTNSGNANVYTRMMEYRDVNGIEDGVDLPFLNPETSPDNYGSVATHRRRVICADATLVFDVETQKRCSHVR